MSYDILQPMNTPEQIPEPVSRTPKTMLPLSIGILALLGIIAGVLTLLFSQTTTQSFGWFAYAPLSDEAFLPGMKIIGDTQILGFVLLAAGLICAAFWAGYKVGKRSS